MQQIIEEKNIPEEINKAEKTGEYTNKEFLKPDRKKNEILVGNKDFKREGSDNLSMVDSEMGNNFFINNVNFVNADGSNMNTQR